MNILTKTEQEIVDIIKEMCMRHTLQEMEDRNNKKRKQKMKS